MAVSSRKCKIALAVAYKIPYHCTVANKLFSLFHQPGIEDLYHPVLFETVFEESLVRDQIKEMTEQYDLVISIGRFFTTLLKKTLVDIGRKDYPFFFAGITDPFALGVVGSLELPGGGVTGVVRQKGTFLESAEYLKLFSKYVKSVFIPYAPFGEEERLPGQVKQISRILESAGLKVTTKETMSTPGNIAAALSIGVEHDAILALEGCRMTEAISEVSRICFDHDTLLFGEGLEAINKGAACAYGGDLRPIAEALFSQVRQFWEDRKQPHQIPVTVLPNNRHFIMNEPRMLQYGIPRELVRKIAHEDKTVELIRKWVNAPA